MDAATSETPHRNLLSRAWYQASISEFTAAETKAILGDLTRSSDYPVLTTQSNAWVDQIELLKSHLANLPGSIFFEFNIPRMGRRIDVVLLVDSIVFAIEFKVGEDTFDRAAIDQVWDYALDLKNFHEASHHVSILPVLIATEAPNSEAVCFNANIDQVYHPISICADDLRKAIDQARHGISGMVFDPQSWAISPYHPTPTIIEAARSLYAQHSVEAIASYDAGKKNLKITSRRIDEIVDEARANQRKVICFVTGVPGAGKTLVGLNVATRHRREEEPTHAVFLSGNGPLVAVLCEALTRDEVSRRKALGERVTKREVSQRVETFIQLVHHFRDEGLREAAPPIEHVVIFDEAQRAWNHRKTANFMKQKKRRPGFTQSEPEVLISYMDRHQDWAVIICLVGGGQEINTGEAGIEAWLDAINSKFPRWDVHISSRLTDTEYAAGHALEQLKARPAVHFDDSLHLSVSMRSFRAENVSAFVKAVLDCDRDTARDAFADLEKRYPIVITRDLPRAKEWVRGKARGSERFGLIASSKAQRLKPHAIDIRVPVDPVHYFLNEKEDTRSSYYLEDAATEFQVQGLELDWSCVTWDGDLRFAGNGWSHHDFRGNRWTNIENSDNRNYLRNAYRVLLTRARQGMVVFVPPGASGDPTRSSTYYDPTFEYLVDLGIPVLT